VGKSPDRGTCELSAVRWMMTGGCAPCGRWSKGVMIRAGRRSMGPGGWSTD
jgi:hypothetical protein